MIKSKKDRYLVIKALLLAIWGILLLRATSLGFAIAFVVGVAFVGYLIIKLFNWAERGSQ